MKTIILTVIVTAFAISTLPLMTMSSAKAECKYTSNSGKARWSC